MNIWTGTLNPDTVTWLSAWFSSHVLNTSSTFIPLRFLSVVPSPIILLPADRSSTFSKFRWKLSNRGTDIADLRRWSLHKSCIAASKSSLIWDSIEEMKYGGAIHPRIKLRRLNFKRRTCHRDGIVSRRASAQSPLVGTHVQHFALALEFGTSRWDRCYRVGVTATGPYWMQLGKQDIGRARYIWGYISCH